MACGHDDSTINIVLVLLLLLFPNIGEKCAIRHTYLLLPAHRATIYSILLITNKM